MARSWSSRRQTTKSGMTISSLWTKGFAAALLLCLGSACTTVDPERSAIAQAAPDVTWVSATQSKNRSATWRHRAFPGKKQTDYHATLHEGRHAVRSESSAAASMLRKTVRVEAADLGQLSFSWKVPALIAGADMMQAHTDDSPVRLVLAFEGDRSKFSVKNAMLSELALTLTGEPLPYATLMYVWGTDRAPGSIIEGPRTDRIRKLVLESGPQQLGRWLDYERDIKADFEKAFGEAPGALVGIGIMTDTDNTILFSFSQLNAVYSNGAKDITDLNGNPSNNNGVMDYASRSSNSLAYTSPSFGGFSGALVLGTGEDKTASVKASRNNSFHLKYANGPLLVGYAYQNEKFNTGSQLADPGSPTGAGDGQRDYNLFGASYDFGVAKITGSYQAAKQKNSLLPAKDDKSKSFQAGVTVPFGAAAISAGYVRSKTDDLGLKAQGFSLFGTYSLSKRTALYAGGLTRKLDLAAGADGTEKSTIVAAGLRHSF